MNSLPRQPIVIHPKLSGKKRRSTGADEEALVSVIRNGCCKNNCFLQMCEGPHNYSRAVSILANCRSELRCMTSDEVQAHLLSKLLTFSFAFHGNRRVVDYVVLHDNVQYSVCYKAFTLSYGITTYSLKQIKKSLENDLYAAHGGFTDFTKVHDETLRDLDSMLKINNVDISERKDLLGRCIIPSSDESMMVYTAPYYCFMILMIL